MPRAVRIHEFGGPEKLTVEDTNIGDPGSGEVLLRHEAAAVHFADVLVREGTYFLKPDLPSGLGLEGAGVIEAVGDGVTDFQPGDRAAYRFNLGAYSDARIIAADQIHALPDNVDAKTAVAGTVRGMTAFTWSGRSAISPPRIRCWCTPPRAAWVRCSPSGANIWAPPLSARPAALRKTEIAKANGCDHVIDYASEDFAARVLEITNGEGVPIAYDGVGAAVYDGTVACLAPRGFYINFGHASGFLPQLDAMELNRKSLVFTKASLKDFVRDPAVMKAMLAEVFDLLGSGVLDPRINAEYALDNIADAQRAIASRETTGAIVVVP